MKKIGFIALSFVVVLALSGIGYSMWTTSITVNGTVNTGKVSVELNQQWSDDPPAIPADSGDAGIGTIYQAGYLDPSGPATWTLPSGESGASFVVPGNYGKNVADTVCVETPIEGDGYTNSMTITINNGYPGYFGCILVGITNNGTIPVAIGTGGFSITDNAVDNASLTQNTWYNYEPGEGAWDTFAAEGGANTQFQDLDNDAQYAIEISAEGAGETNSLTQIDPGQTGYFNVQIQVLEDAAQGTSYSFTLTAPFANWNEVS